MQLDNYLHFVTDLAYRAGRITLGYFNAGVRPDYKADDTPVTAADRAAEEFIRGEIEKKYPTHAILGEEFGSSDYPLPKSASASASQSVAHSAVSIRLSASKSVTQSAASAHRWIIDPIDGTKSFMRGVPLYGVLIGLEIDGVIRVGAAYYPGTDEMLTAADGLGCWWNGRRAHVSEISSFERACACYTTIHNFEKQGRKDAFERIQKAFYQVRGWSDAYGYLLVATGRVEAMLDPIMNIWDCGPFPVIFREAGGYFGSWDGRAGHDHNEAIACNASIKDKLFELIR